MNSTVQGEIGKSLKTRCLVQSHMKGQEEELGLNPAGSPHSWVPGHTQVCHSDVGDSVGVAVYT